jgi:hypothetical protein
MKQKRAPGGGRKPQGEFKGNAERLSLRVTPQVRRDLEASAKKGKVSLNQEAQFHLEQSLLKFYRARPDINVLTEIIVKVIQDIERLTGKLQWNKSPYVADAVRHAIDRLLRHWGAPGEPKVPLAIKELAKRWPDDKKLQEPAEFGSWVAGSLITEIENRALIEGEGPHKLPADYEFPGIGQPPDWEFYRKFVIPRLGSRPRYWKDRSSVMKSRRFTRSPRRRGRVLAARFRSRACR